jgi:hypothetical protein
VAISALAKKLQIKPGMQVALVNAPAGIAKSLEPLPDRAALVPPGPSRDAVIAFVGDDAELRRIAPQAVKSLKNDGLLWLAYPKGTARTKTDLNRDILREVVAERHGFEGVSLVAVDETWSAMRFRPRPGSGTAVRRPARE